MMTMLVMNQYKMKYSSDAPNAKDRLALRHKASTHMREGACVHTMSANLNYNLNVFIFIYVK
jgi:hypothetical protein